MSRDNIDLDNLDITGVRPRPETSALSFTDDVIIIVNEAYGPDGDSLVGISDVEFDGFAALTLLVRGGGREEQVHLSPIHGDRRKIGMENLPAGTKCELLCPVSRKPLPKVGRVDDGPAEYCAIYLTKRLEAGSTIYVSDVWGHHHSRIVDNFELISAWAMAEDGAD